MKILKCFLYCIILTIGMTNNALAQNIYASFDSGKLKLLIPTSILIPQIDHFLNNSDSIPKKLINSRTEKASVRRFRSSFIDRKIRTRFDYSYKSRECNKKPFGSGWWCTPWVSDSGWAEVDLWPSISNWKVSANTRSGHIRWDSNNWFTRTFLKSFIDNDLRSGISNQINSSIKNIIGGRSVDLKRLVINKGSSVIARSFRISNQEAIEHLSNVLNQVRLNSYVNQDGLYIALSVPNRSPKPHTQTVRQFFFCKNNNTNVCERQIRYIDVPTTEQYSQFTARMANLCNKLGYPHWHWNPTYDAVNYWHRDSRSCKYWQ